MKSSTKDNAEGKMHQMKGKIKEVAGKITGDRDLEAEGKDGNAQPAKFKKRSARSRRSLGSKHNHF